MAATTATKGSHEWDFLYKLVIIGDPAVGKSSILLQFAVRTAVRTGVIRVNSALNGLAVDPVVGRVSGPFPPQDGVFNQEIGATLGVDFVSFVIRWFLGLLRPGAARTGGIVSQSSAHSRFSEKQDH